MSVGLRNVFRASAVVSSLLLVFFIAGCSKRYHNLPAFSAFPIQDPVNNSVGRFKTSYLADQIHAYFRGQSQGPIAVSTLVDIDNLYTSSTFGRIVAEQMMSELSMRGYNVLELRQSEAVQVLTREGEFGLSREIEALRGVQNLSGMVVGTYAVSPIRVYLNLRLIDPLTSRIMSVGTVEMRKTKEIARLLRSNSLPTTMERIPVRSLGYSPHWNNGWPNWWQSQVAPSSPGWEMSDDEKRFLEENEKAKTPMPKLGSLPASS